MNTYVFLKVIYKDGKIEYYGKKQMFIQVNQNKQICAWDKKYAYQNTSTATRGIQLLKDKLSSIGIKQGKWRIIDVVSLTCYED
jgi:hypothetical protein